ncbi:DEHA2C02310p [Debaryomyces hansenii CBS767]|uniref:DEHA2C02310p n=1 Tax=Debaryomyces hansenii (strain ATCC 36239 / CBS 767 / BCRC 21394 / JCM 1990 / NBRC 0083 / IGC 2968) TaxID=284592 RepID=B5RT62_DEBHA|nr:DEHA2C02310p [Debaryomyces hansenii CBS767]CAR65524.1 DEHA2C02310p [Debaryomyces hansenii CBS767]|eukprot:XP_002770157.1 DEHA2C02310p [Debaryomyces hansenii CBS767]
MTKSSSKQRLSTMDIPDPIPANLHNLDLSYAIDTFQVGTYKMEDLPQTLPVFNKKTGSITRYAKGRRVTSMPILSHEPKCLPELPPKVEVKLGMKRNMKRSVSMFPQNIPLQDQQEFSKTRSSEIIIKDDKDLASATAKNTPITEADSLFSQTSIIDSTSASSIPSDEFTQMSVHSRKSIFEVNDRIIDDSSSSIYSEVDIEDDTLDDIYAVEMCLEEPELGSIFDGLSLDDSLWDSDKESIKCSQAKTGSYASTSILEYYNTQSDDQIGVRTPIKQKNSPRIDTKKELPSVPHSPVDNGLVLPKVRKNRIPRPASMFSMTNQSNFSSFTGSKSLHESKQEMKSAINGSIDVCLDPGNNYGYSRYSFGISKPRATSTSLLSPLSTSFNTSPNVIKPRASSTHLMNSTQYTANITPHVEETSAPSSHKLNTGRSVSAFISSTFRAFSSELSTITKK